MCNCFCRQRLPPLPAAIFWIHTKPFRPEDLARQLPPEPPVIPDECEDTDENCENWAKAGECDKNPQFMRVSRQLTRSNTACPAPVCAALRCVAAADAYCGLCSAAQLPNAPPSTCPLPTIIAPVRRAAPRAWARAAAPVANAQCVQRETRPVGARTACEPASCPSTIQTSFNQDSSELQLLAAAAPCKQHRRNTRTPTAHTMLPGAAAKCAALLKLHWRPHRRQQRDPLPR